MEIWLMSPYTVRHCVFICLLYVGIAAVVPFFYFHGV